MCKPERNEDTRDGRPTGQIDIITVIRRWIASSGEVGRTYAVVPKRGEPAVWWHDVGGLRYYEEPVYSEGYDLKAYYMQNHWQPLRIRITAIRQERLQDITEADARAEGVADVGEYRELWQRINGKTKGARWDDNPDVWVITFELVTEN